SRQERSLFEEHLARCQTCAQETREFRETAARLAAAAAQPPPDGLKEKVLATAALTRQLPPLSPAPQPARLGRRGRRPARTDAIPRPRRRRLSLLRVGWSTLGAAMALGAAIAAVGIFAVIGNIAPGGPPRTNARIAAVLTAPDAITLTAAVRNGGTSTIVMSPTEGRLVFAASGLAPLPPAKCYILCLLP